MPLQTIYRSPQLRGYRNKAEFTIGLDGRERPAVGFLLGAYRVRAPLRRSHLHALACAAMQPTHTRKHTHTHLVRVAHMQ